MQHAYCKGLTGPPGKYLYNKPRLSITQYNKIMKALIIEGQNEHHWQRSRTSIALKQIIEKSGIFTANIMVSPARDEDINDFVVGFSPYNVVLLDYTGQDWPEKTRHNFVEYVKNGGGVVVCNKAASAFPGWPEYNEIAGLGGYAGQENREGVSITIQDGAPIYNSAPGKGKEAGQYHEFAVQSLNPSHPILKGLPERWLHAEDMLPAGLRGPAKNLEVLAYAHSYKGYGGSGNNEPVMMTIRYGEGRVFHTTLGHSDNDPLFPPAIECAGFITTLRRGTEWAATGNVLQDVPSIFPSETSSLRWPFYEDIQTDIEAVIQRIQTYETGKSIDCFHILQLLVQENSGDQDSMDILHQQIIRLLTAEETTNDSKRILCRDFSWMANEPYRKVYKKLKENQVISAEAEFALNMMTP